ncbi:MAG: hypothetical protein IJD07_02740 [Clostridia bacterium]|nr:hypothetical protein [Clostridia bacterium]
MKRFILLVGVILLLVGVRILDRGILRVSDSGDFFVQTEQGMEQAKIPLLNTADSYQRLDTCGVTLTEALSRMSARAVMIESLDDMQIYYCYSPYIKHSVLLKGKTVNLMIAVRDSDMIIGSPLIKGCY